MRCSNCGKCCEKTEMELSSDDIRRLEKAGRHRDQFSVLDNHVIRLRNVGGWCCFYSLAERNCQVYKNRPLGCRLYPVVHLADEGAIVDELCPMGHTVSERELRTKGKILVRLFSLQKVRASQLQALKKNLVGKVYVRVIKNTLMKLAVENCKEKADPEKLKEYLTGANVYLFTDLNPFKLTLLLEKGKVRTTAKSGDTAAFDVIVPAGNTGQAPGPIISQLNAVGLPTRIESGSVWINKDTLVVRKGEAISERLASVLSKLGIKPVEAGLKMKIAYDDGLIITETQLQIDVKETMHAIEEAYADVFALSLTMAYPTLETIRMLVQIAHKEAYALALNAATPTKETIADLIRKASMEMLSLSSRLPTLEEKTPSTQQSEKS